ncbi:MAG TPA: VOC family protein [Gaiellaceae bacterium]|jgi:catechol 2,3-dioxygenase-like lactoylglutathione lyase family enzyme|nr:VOC family protein [Gaiellaceae bacterium]
MTGERIFHGGPAQIGIVVPDVEAAIERYRALFGYDDWLVVENGPWNLHGLHVRGEPADFSMRLGLYGSDPQIELLQPLAGDDILGDWLRRGGRGLHHLGYEVASVDETIAAMDGAGFACLQHGYGFGADGSGGFAYFDTERELGYLVEALEPANA